MNKENTAFSILIVEDEAIIAKDIASRLTKLGYTVTGIASNCQQALKLIEQKLPDMVLMDIIIKGEYDGIESAHIINDKYSIPVVYLTAHSDVDTVERTKFTNPYGFISKPVDDRDLNVNIRNAMYRYDAERKLKDFKEKYYRLAENSKDIIFKFSYIDNTFDFINNACIDITGHTPDEFYTNPMLYNVFFKPNEMNSAKKNSHHIASEYPILDKHNNKKWVKLSAIVLADSAKVPYAIEGILYNITDKILYEEKLRNTNEKLHALAAHLESIREDERWEISRELHDQFGQDLTGLKLTLSLLLKKLANREAEIDRSLFDTELKLVISKIDEVFSNMRRITTDLRPDVLERLGLIEAVNWQVDNFSNKSSIKCDIRITGDDSKIPPKTGLAIYRIIQELLTNISRHSKADRAELLLNFMNGSIRLEVNDNGKGIEMEKLDDPKSFGIIGIQERVYQLGGTVSFSQLQPGGSECVVNVPL
ncbi:MAG TPA: response regulator [Ignavibacteria bacterium]